MGSGDSDRAVILHILIGDQFLPVRVRLISGGAVLLLEMEIIGKLNITVGYGKREFHIGHGEWKAMTRKKKNRWVPPPCSNSDWVRKIGRIFRENQKSRFRSLGDARGSRRYFGN